jgi:hypothetical protein
MSPSRRLAGWFASLALLAVTGIAAAEDPATKVLLGPNPTASKESFEVMKVSFEQFAHVDYLLRIFLSLTLAAGCAWLVAMHPRRATKLDPLSDLEERKALILLGVVGAVIAELSSTSQTLAFVIFGIGALLRFRTLLNNAKITGKAIMVVVIGLGCGMGQWAMAVFVTLYTWMLVYWLDSHMSWRVRIRLRSKAVDLNAMYAQSLDILRNKHIRIQNSSVYDEKRQMIFLVHAPAAMDPSELEADMKAKIAGADEARIDIQVG